MIPYKMRRFLAVTSVFSVPLLIDFLITIFFLTTTGSVAGIGAGAGAGAGCAGAIDAFDFWGSDSCEEHTRTKMNVWVLDWADFQFCLPLAESSPLRLPRNRHAPRRNRAIQAALHFPLAIECRATAVYWDCVWPPKS